MVNLQGKVVGEIQPLRTVLAIQQCLLLNNKTFRGWPQVSSHILISAIRLDQQARIRTPGRDAPITATKFQFHPLATRLIL